MDESIAISALTRPNDLQSIPVSVQWQVFEDIHKVPERVNQYLRYSKHGSVFQYPPWHLFTSEKPERYKVIAAFEAEAPIFAAVVYMSPIPGLNAYKGSIDRGPVFEDEAHAISLWDDFEKQLKRWRLCSLEVHPFWQREETRKLRAQLERRGYIKYSSATCHTETLTISLNPTEEEIFKGLKGSRNRIRKAMSMGIQVRGAQSIDEMKSFWHMYRDMCHSKELNCGPCRLFENVWRFSMAYPQDCICLLGWLDKTLIGGYIILRHGDVVEITRGGASTTVDPQVPKTDLIFWEAIRWAKQTGASVCDLGGITPDAEEGSPKWNVNRFKKKFSDHQVSLFEPMEKVFNQRLYGLHDVLKRIKKNVTQHLPV